MRSDLLSKRIYYAGWVGLPWLWIVHALYHWNSAVPSEDGSNNNNNNNPLHDPNDMINRRNERDANNMIINPDDHFHDEPTAMTTEQIHMEALKWVSRGKISAFIMITIWITWIIIAQVLRDQLPVSLYILPDDSQRVTGW